MTYLGLDLGSKTCGIAISDRTGLIATSLEVIRYNDYDELINKLNNIVISRNVDAFVLGNPKNLDGSLSKRSEITLEFKDLLLKKFNMEELCDYQVVFFGNGRVALSGIKGVTYLSDVEIRFKTKTK